ncbi:MAG: tetratricopeptide repeat protein, partial [Acidobacteriia bacterium]|nr:tetratricopeptide repeat protein [Terriglobia bacterium]
AYERNHDYKSAAEALRRALELSPDNSHIQEALARDLLFSDQLDEALKLYQGLASDEPREPAYRLRVAQIYRSKHDLAKAREELNKAKQLDPENVDVAYEEVNLLDAEGKSDQAVARLKALLDQTERRTYSASQSGYRAQLLERLGLLYRNSNDYQQAIAAFRQIAALDNSGAPRVAGLIIDTYRQAKDFDSALREADAALKKFPEERMVHIAHAEVLSDQGKIDQAVAELTALPKGDHDFQLQIEMAQLYEKGKRWADMSKSLADAEKLASSDDEKETVLFLRGAMYERTKKYDEAEAMFRKVLDVSPNNAGALNYLGYMLADRNVRLDEAYRFVRKALDLDPQNGAYLDSMGWVYYRQGKLNEAEETLVRAIDRIGQDPTVHDHLGDVYFKLGKTKEAAAQWQASVKGYQTGAPSDNDPEELAKVNKKLESARVRLAKETSK